MASSVVAKARMASLVFMALMLFVSRSEPADAGGGDVATDSVPADTAEHVRALVSENPGERRSASETYCREQMNPARAEYFPCILNRFRLTEDARGFVARIPTDPGDLASLWQVDAIVQRGVASPTQIPKPMGAATFLAAFLQAMNGIARSGKPEALDRLLVIQRGADGWMAEEVEQSNLDLLASEPSLLVDHWDVVTKHEKELGFGTTDFEARRKTIEQKYKAYCAETPRPADACERALRFLAQN